MNKRIKKKKDKQRDGYKLVKNLLIAKDIDDLIKKYPELKLFEKNYCRWRFYLKKYKTNKRYTCLGNNHYRYE